MQTTVTTPHDWSTVNIHTPSLIHVTCRPTSDLGQRHAVASSAPEKTTSCVCACGKKVCACRSAHTLHIRFVGNCIHLYVAAPVCFESTCFGRPEYFIKCYAPVQCRRVVYTQMEGGRYAHTQFIHAMRYQLHKRHQIS